MTRAAIYARFSSDLQRDRSIEDQVALCQDFAGRNGLTVVETWEDRARSGASIMGRDGLLAMMDAGRQGQFDVLVIEALDRLSRDQEDLAGIYKRLTFAGVEIRAVHDGVADQVQIGIRGLVGALYLQDLAHKVRRGMAGVTRDGRHAGGRAYGYRTVPGAPGELVIDEDEAEIVRRIYAEYVAGAKPRAIAGGLNADGIAPPRGRYWAAGVLNGNKKRGHGILVNPLYAGEMVWNRVRMIKDPGTGKRVSRVNPQDQWQRVPVPDLAIIDRELFDAAQRLNDASGWTQAWQQRRPKGLLSGLLKCGCCGGGMSIKDRAAGRVRLHCTAAKEGGACSNTKSIYLDTVEPVVLDGLKTRLRDKRAIAAYLRVYNEERKALAADKIAKRSKVEGRLAIIERDLDRAISLAVKGVLTEAEAAEQISALKKEREALTADMATMGEAPKLIELHPTMVRDYLATIDELESALQADAGNAEHPAFGPIRSLIESVTITPQQIGAALIRVEGRLNGLVGGNQFPAMALGGLMVAEEGFEPPTRGL